MSRYDEEIDLKPYVMEVIHHWRLILILGFVLASAGLAYSLLQPRTYLATATILLTRTRASLELAEQFPTISEPIDSRSRMDALLAITQSDAIAFDSLAALSSSLPPDVTDFEIFKNRVTVRSNGDAVQIVAEARQPELAAQIANEWAQKATQSINLAYSGDQPLSEINIQLSAARTEYESAQADLEGFIDSNRIKTLEIQLNDADSSLLLIVTDRSQRLAYYANRKIAMEALAVQAEALKGQIEQGSRSESARLGDALAVLLNRAIASGLLQNPAPASAAATEDGFATAPGLTIDIQLSDLGALQTESDSLIADLEGLIRLADLEHEIAETAINALSTIPPDSQIAGLLDQATAQRQALETALEREKARHLELTSERDLAWEAYQALAQKQVEIRNAAQTQSLVTLASRAVPPSQPASRGTAINTLVGGILGGALALSWVFGSFWWRSGGTPPEHTLANPDNSDTPS